jgi:hypothetical protein
MADQCGNKTGYRVFTGETPAIYRLIYKAFCDARGLIAAQRNIEAQFVALYETLG